MSAGEAVFKETDPPKRWTKITIADSDDGEVTLLVRKTELSLSEMIEDLIIPAMYAKGYRGVENYIFDHEGDE